VEKDYQWFIFAATDPLLAMMARFGIYPTVITEADPSRIAGVNIKLGLLSRRCA
jgi:hypothetical protein